MNPEVPSEQAQSADDVFGRFFAQSRDLLCVAGSDGYFRYLNLAWTGVLGWSLEELKARPFVSFVHRDDRAATQVELTKLDGGAESILFENRYIRQDGSFRWLQWNAWPAPARREIYATARDVTREKWLEGAILEVADRERARLGRELHDGLCQSLAGISALSSALSQSLAASSNSDASAVAAEIATLLNESMIQARDMSRGLVPFGRNETDLGDTLETLALNVRRMFRVTCTFECDRSFPRPSPEAANHLVRIAQEAANNAITHGKTDRIAITLSSKGESGLLRIEDAGVGVPDNVGRHAGVGLYTMAQRALLIGGSLEVRRRDPRGTAVTCVFPLPGAPDAQEKPDHVREDD